MWQNQPNPFGSATRIRYAVPRRTPVSLDVFDLRGQRVASLVRETQDPGSYSVPFGPGVATVDGGRVGALGPGVYFYRFRAGMFESTRRMLLMR